MTKKLLAILFCFSCLATTAFADAKRDCANAKIHPARIVRSCTKVIEADPKAAWAFVNRAKNYPQTIANYRKIIADFSTAIEIDPHNAQAFLGRAEAHITRSQSMGTVPANNPNFYIDLALPDLNAAIAADPELISAYQRRGWFYMDKEVYDHAIPDFDKVISRNPDWSAVYGVRALAYRGMGKYDLAIADFDKEFTLTGRGTRKDYETRGLTHSLNGNNDAAIADYKRAIASGVEYVDTKLNLAYAHFNKSDYKAAAGVLTSTQETVSDMSWKLLRFLAIQKSGQHLDRSLSAIADTLHYKDWHLPLAELYLGKRKVTPEQALLIGERPREKCMALFFFAEWNLQREELPNAVRLLKHAADICPKDAVELGAVKAELKRLKA
jgi:tetratricopeptide (TPR) repeat protein